MMDAFLDGDAGVWEESSDISREMSECLGDWVGVEVDMVVRKKGEGENRTGCLTCCAIIKL
jgi:hypothetical protein